MKWKENLAHGAMAYLLALGLVLTLLGVTGLSGCGVLCALTLLVADGLAMVASVNRRAGLIAGCFVGFAALVWLGVGGMSVVIEVMRALIWHLSGLTTALPLVADAFTVLVSLLCLAAAWFVTQRSAGPYPALLLLIIAALLLWLGDMPQVLWCLLPAVLACVTLLLRASDDSVSTVKVMPLAAVITAIGFGGMAAGGMVYEPLYDLAQDIRQRIYDTLFYTAPRDVFTLATEGYYPQGQGQLGGPAQPHTDPVMVVLTPRKTYLRGVIKNVYTGRSWEDDIGGRRYLWNGSGYAELRRSAFDEALPVAGSGSELLQARAVTMRMLGASASSLFVPQRVRSLEVQGDLIAYFNTSSEVFATRNLAVGDVWTVQAPLMTAMDSGIGALVALADTVSDPQWDAVCKRYLQLPEHLEQQVYELARTAARGAESPYETAMALQTYLASNYRYTLDAEPQSPDMDFVSTFLLVNKEGYCTYFASAMTVLCRMLGLPARYVEGYLATPDASGMAVVTGEEGHAWTEVYFRGFGWLTFDATPMSLEYVQLPEGSSQPDDAPDVPTPTPEPTASPSPSPTVEPMPSPAPEQDEEDAHRPTPSASPTDEPSATAAPMQTPDPDGDGGIPWVAVLLITLLAVRSAFVQPGVQAARQKTEFARWMVWAQAVHDVLKQKGFVRENHESPGAFFQRVTDSGDMPQSLAALGAAENLMFYGHVDPMPEETAQVRAMYEAVYRSLTGSQRMKLQLDRTLTPKRQRGFTLNRRARKEKVR